MPIHKCRLALIGFPYDANSSYLKGSASAPPLIREALHSESSNMWSESGIDLVADGLVRDAGDLALASSDDAFEKIEGAIAELLARNCLPVALGGDHSVTIPIVRAFKKQYPRIHLLYLDAHPDLYDVFAGDAYSHACTCARILEEGLVERLVQVGVRTMNGNQRQQADGFGVEVVEMKDEQENIDLAFDAPLYVSLDVDVLDPAFAPGVSHVEPGGLTTRQVIQIIQRMRAPSIVGADIVEYNPQKDPTGMTARVCAKLLKELVGRMRSLHEKASE